MNIAVIGLGNIGTILAKTLTAGGKHIIIADHTKAKADKLAGELDGKAEPQAVTDALNNADVVILAIYLEAIKEMIKTTGDVLATKIVVDPTNPIAPDGKGGFTKTIPAEQSSGELIGALLSPGTQLVKAFGSLGAASLASGSNRTPERAVLFYATDYPQAGTVIADLITASGFSPVNVGGINQSLRIEVGGDLHEFGKLGKLVSVQEATKVV
jgi:predicted dinucleotide-binding enzyme